MWGRGRRNTGKRGKVGPNLIKSDTKRAGSAGKRTWVESKGHAKNIFKMILTKEGRRTEETRGTKGEREKNEVEQRKKN